MKICLQRSLFLLGCLLFGVLQAQEIEVWITRYTKDREALFLKYPNTESSAFYERFVRYGESFARELTSLNFSSLSRIDQIDYLLLKNQIEKDLYFLKLDQTDFKEVSHVLSFAGPLHHFIDQRRAGTNIRSDSLAKSFDDVNRAIIVTKEYLQKTPFPTWQQAAKASKIVNHLRDEFQEAYHFYQGYDPQFTWWMKTPQAALDTTLRRYASFLKDHFSKTSVKDDGSGIIGKPIGRDAIIRSLQTEFIPYSPEELVAIAQKQLAWCDKEMLKATQEFGLGTDWKEALEKVKNSYVEPGKQPAMVAGLAEEAIRFMEAKDLITVPELAKDTWRMRMMTPEEQKVNPFFLGGEEIILSYPTNTMTHREKMMSMRGNNPHFSRATVHHELIPGHHLQGFMQSRYKPYRGVFNTPFWIEGWALYWEMNLWDKGFAQTPQDRIGMLFWRMHRCARIIFSLNYHLGKMSPQQCIDFLVTRVGHEYANAEAEVRRSFTEGYDPLYQIAYMIGVLQITALKNELVSMGKMTEKQFHDRLLKENCIPIEILRLILSEEKLSPDYKTKWRFVAVN